MRCIVCGATWFAHVLCAIEACWCFTPEQKA